MLTRALVILLALSLACLGDPALEVDVEPIIVPGCDGHNDPNHPPPRCEGTGGGGGGAPGGGGGGGGGGTRRIDQCGVNHDQHCTGCGWFGSSPCLGDCLPPMQWYPHRQSCGYAPGTICRQDAEVTCEIDYYGYCRRCRYR